MQKKLARAFVRAQDKKTGKIIFKEYHFKDEYYGCKNPKARKSKDTYYEI